MDQELRTIHRHIIQEDLEENDKNYDKNSSQPISTSELE